jgi:hypothetical protein
MRFSGLGRSKSGLAQNHANDDSPRLLLHTVVYSMRLVAESRTGWDVARRRALAQCASDERRRVPRTFWGSREPRAVASTRPRVAPVALNQMGVWCASATDGHPRERKTGCAWRDDRESSDASRRQRFRAPLDKGPVNGRRLYGRESTNAKDRNWAESRRSCRCVHNRPFSNG